MERTGWNSAAVTALLVLSQISSPAVAARGTRVVVAQAETSASPAANPAPDSKAEAKASNESHPSPAPASRASGTKAVLAIPVCSMRYVAAKISGKLNGRKWSDFRREDCGQKDTQAVFPSAIAPKYSGEEPDKARTHTCADQFAANKANNANGGLNWIGKDGGYYAECVAHLNG